MSARWQKRIGYGLLGVAGSMILIILMRWADGLPFEWNSLFIAGAILGFGAWLANPQEKKKGGE